MRGPGSGHWEREDLCLSAKFRDFQKGPHGGARDWGLSMRPQRPQEGPRAQGREAKVRVTVAQVVKKQEAQEVSHARDRLEVMLAGAARGMRQGQASP